jgi:hypothetical protein
MMCSGAVVPGLIGKPKSEGEPICYKGVNVHTDAGNDG